jgi:hypothetical protein
MRRLATTVLAAFLLTLVFSAAPAEAVKPGCDDAAAQGMKGTGNYTSDAALIARFVKNPSAPAYVLFRLKFATATCAAVKYLVTVLDAANGAVLATSDDHGPGTFSTALGAYVIEFQIPITQFQPTDTATPPNGTPSGVCVSDQVTIDLVVVHQGPSGTCAIPGGGATWPGQFLQLNPGSGGGGEFDM